MAAIMITNTQTALGVTDDNMEISSDAGRLYDDYLDIDIDLGEHIGNADAEDYMVEDETAVGTNIASDDNRYVDDDMMDKIDDGDGFMTYGQETQDEELQDAIFDDEGDTEIAERQDYLEDNFDDHTNEIESTSEPPVALQPSNDTVELNSELATDLQIKTDFLDAQVPNGSVEFSEQVTLVSDEKSADIQNEGLHFVEEEPAEVVVGGELLHATLEHTVDALSPSNSVNVSDQISAEEPSPTTQAPLDSVVNVTTEAMVKRTAPLQSFDDSLDRLDHRVHPVIMVYAGQEIDLFPAAEGNEPTQYFLADRSMVDANLLDFLASCRTVLREHVTENEALEIDLVDLGLTLNEDSNQAALFSLADVLNVYVQLCENDGLRYPDPLYINLATKPRFASRMTDLSSATRDGKGFSEVFPSDNVEPHSSEVEVHGQAGDESPEYPHSPAAHHFDAKSDDLEAIANNEITSSPHIGVDNLEKPENYETAPSLEYSAASPKYSPAVYRFDAKVDDLEKIVTNEISLEAEENTKSYAKNADDAAYNIGEKAQSAQNLKGVSEKVSHTAQAEETSEIGTTPEQTDLYGNEEEPHEEVADNPYTIAKDEITSTAVAYFEDELWDYDDEEESAAKDEISNDHSSSSSTLQGEISSKDAADPSPHFTTKTHIDRTTHSSGEVVPEAQDGFEPSNSDANLQGTAEDDIDYSLDDHEYDINHVQEYKDELEDFEDFNASDQKHDNRIDDITEFDEHIKHFPPSATTDLSSRPGSLSTSQAENKKSPLISTPSRKRYRADEEDDGELGNVDSENDAKKSRPS